MSDGRHAAEVPSWEVAREGAPARPAFETNLPETMFTPRPKRVIVAFVLVALAALTIIVMTGLGALQFDALRDAMIEALPDDITSDYDEADIERAAVVILAAIGALSLIISIGQLLTARALAFRRSVTARVVHIVMLVLSVPAALLALIVREAGMLDMLLTGTALGIFVIAAIMVCTPIVSVWLRQSDEHRTIPLVPRDRVS